MKLPTIAIPTGAWNYRAGITAEQVLESARKAEAAGIDALFTGDHVTFYGAGNDGLISLIAVATATEHMQLMTSVYLLALRHPTPVALQCATLDQLSRGRFVFGVGVGGERDTAPKDNGDLQKSSVTRARQREFGPSMKSSLRPPADARPTRRTAG